jgi:predicted metal-dependent peptidase
MTNFSDPQLQRCYDVALRGAWHHPFFLVPLGYVAWAAAQNTEHVKTMTIFMSPNGHATLEINTEWTRGLDDEELFGVLCHEIMHPMLQHVARSEGKNPVYWGQATDMAINATLRQSKIRLPKTALYPPDDHADAGAEQLYELLVQEEIPQPQGYDPDQVGAGCLPQPGSNPGQPGQSQGDEQPQDGQGDEQPQDGQGQAQGDGQQVWGELLAQAEAMERQRGSGTLSGFAKLFKPRPVKKTWEALLKRTATKSAGSAGRDNQTWQRINRRSEEFILPGWKSARPSIGVIVDSSGSVSDDMLATSISNVIACAKISGVKFFLALHDGACYYADWIRPETTVESISKLCTHRGGTNPAPAFEAVEAAKARFDALVYLTDGEVGRYPDKPRNVRRVIVGVVGESSYRSEIPDGWTEVPIEVK